MSKIIDFFGFDTTAREDREWYRILDEQKCYFTGRRCFKTRKSSPGIAIGTCTVEYGGNPVIICPNRLLERKQVFIDCLHLLTGHQPGNELHVIPEVSIPGGNLDFILASTYRRNVVDFVGIELQTLDTTGSIWPVRQEFLISKGIEVDSFGEQGKKGFGMNWKMTAKTILVQLHHKIKTFEHLNKHLVLVVQDILLAYMRSSFAFSHLGMANIAEPMHFHSYSLIRSEEGHGLDLCERLSTDTEGIQRCLGLQVEARVELELVIKALQGKISDQTLFVIA